MSKISYFFGIFFAFYLQKWRVDKMLKKLADDRFYLEKGENLNKFFHKNKKFSDRDGTIKMNVKLGGDTYGKLQKKDMNISVSFSKA